MEDGGRVRVKKINRIYIVGIYGSGKSNLANNIKKILEFKVYDLYEVKYERVDFTDVTIYGSIEK